MEFKGTKGKFYTTSIEQGLAKGLYIGCENQEQKYFLCQLIENGKTKEQNEANQLLFSKAPEMLEMLIEVMETTTDKFRYEKINELIKQATEL